MARFVCVNCGNCYPNEGLPHHCPSCGGFFTLTDLVYDPKAKRGLPGMWAYRELMGVSENPVCYLGEGQTALVERKTDTLSFYAKLESLNPSGSFKDRNSAIVSSFLRARGVRSVVEDSSGNAGASLALYTAAFGIDSKIFVPTGTTGPKVRQIIDSGAQVVPVAGPRENAHQAALAELLKGKDVYASHAMLPFGMAAYATIAWEIFEQLGQLPDRVFCPIGHGSLFFGLLQGFKAISQYLGLSKRPGMIGVQPERCSPLASAWRGQQLVKSGLPSLAEGTMVADPVRGKEILAELKPGWDNLVAVAESEIWLTYSDLARMGIYVEPTSAMVYTALKNCPAAEGINVLVFSGNGLKFDDNKK